MHGNERNDSNPSPLVILWGLGLMVPFGIGMFNPSVGVFVPLLIYVGLSAGVAAVNYRLNHR